MVDLCKNMELNGAEVGNNIPVWSVSAIFLLVDIARHQLNIAAATFNFLLKLYGVLDHQCPALVTELRYLG